MIRFQIHVERDMGRELLWQEDIPPFCSFGRGAQWWEDRVIWVADFAGHDVTFHLTAERIDGRECPQLAIGFDRVALLRIEPLIFTD